MVSVSKAFTIGIRQTVTVKVLQDGLCVSGVVLRCVQPPTPLIETQNDVRERVDGLA